MTVTRTDNIMDLFVGIKNKLIIAKELSDVETVQKNVYAFFVNTYLSLIETDFLKVMQFLLNEDSFSIHISHKAKTKTDSNTLYIDYSQMADSEYATYLMRNDIWKIYRYYLFSPLRDNED